MLMIAFVLAFASTCQGQSGEVVFVEYREKGGWKDWTDGHVKLRIPKNWSVAVEVPKNNIAGRDARGGNPYHSKESWSYLVLRNGRKVAFTIDVERYGNDLAKVMAGRLDEYQYSEKDGFRIWELEIDEERRIFMVANATLQLCADIKYRFEREPLKLRYILESIRPVSEDQTVHQSERK